MCNEPNSKKQLRVRSITYVRYGATPMPAICDFGATLTQYLLRPVDAALPGTEDARASTQMARCGFSQTVAGTIKKFRRFFGCPESKRNVLERVLEPFNDPLWTCSKMEGRPYNCWRATRLA